MGAQEIYKELDRMGISYQAMEHPAVYTIEEVEQLNLDPNNNTPKNLFLREDRKKRYFLVVLAKHKRADLKQLQEKLNSRSLGFASEKDLDGYLKLKKGSVTPLGILNDTQRKVEVIFDSEVLSYEQIGVHPNVNTATVWLKPADLIKMIESHGTSYLTLQL